MKNEGGTKRVLHSKKYRRALKQIAIGLILIAGFMFLQEQGYSGESSGSSASRPATALPITVEMLDRFDELPGGLARLPEPPVPKTNPSSPAKIELGKMLFFDPRLSGNGHWACATCHNPSFAFTDALPRALGFLEIELGRNTPTLLNVAYNTHLLWDGRADSLEDQAKIPILNKQEMNISEGELVERLNHIPEYRKQFKEVFGGDATLEKVLKAIAAFERTLTTGDSPFDRYLAGDKQALTLEQKRGLILFTSKAACTQCHNGPNLSDNQFHNIGTRHVGPLPMDMGRYTVTQDAKDIHAFKTPGLRAAAVTPPYMHDGVLETLEDVVAFYNKGGEDLPNKSPKIFQLGLTKQEQMDLVAFLKALTGRLPEVKPPPLPAGR